MTVEHADGRAHGTLRKTKNARESGRTGPCNKTKKIYTAQRQKIHCKRCQHGSRRSLSDTICARRGRSFISGHCCSLPVSFIFAFLASLSRKLNLTRLRLRISKTVSVIFRKYFLSVIIFIVYYNFLQDLF